LHCIFYMSSFLY